VGRKLESEKTQVYAHCPETSTKNPVQEFCLGLAVLPDLV
jgi:hypothetical protein